jgi:hypothetical protein
MEPSDASDAKFAPSTSATKPKVVIKMGMCSWTDKTFDGTFYPLKNTRTAGALLLKVSFGFFSVRNPYISIILCYFLFQ